MVHTVQLLKTDSVLLGSDLSGTLFLFVLVKQKQGDSEMLKKMKGNVMFVIMRI